MAISKALKYALGALAALLALFLILVVWSANAVTRYPVPPRIEAPLHQTPDTSTLVTQVTADFSTIRARLERALPKTLVTINRREEDCVPKQQVKALGVELFKTPRLGCTLVGEITRGAITLGGQGRNLRATVPIAARIEVQDLGDIIKSETVTAAADVTVIAALKVSENWRLNSDVDLRYRWTTEPGLDVMGQRLELTGIADKQLARSLKDIENELEAEIRKVNLRAEVEKVWAEAHDTLSINRENPPVWMRVTPREIGAGALRVSGSGIAADVMLGAGLELKVGARPDPAQPAPLGANAGVPAQEGFEISVPVLADYSELEPVLLKELQELSMTEILGEKAGAIEADFQSVTIYATEGGKIAVGIEAQVTPKGWLAERYWARTRGRLWLTADPVTQEGAEVLRIRNLDVHGDMDQYAGDLLVGFLDRPVVKGQIQSALTTNFRKDYDRIVAKAQEGLKQVAFGDARLSFEVDVFTHGRVTVTGAGLFMPVVAKGSVSTRLTR